MVIRFKYFILLLLMSLQLDASYVRKVVVNDESSTQIKQKLIKEFQGTIVSEDQIDYFLIQLKQGGDIQSITYSLEDSINGSALSFNVTYTPIINQIIFQKLPISQTRLIEKMKSQTGERFNYRFLEDDIRLINQELIESGYILASIRSIYLNSNSEMIIDIEHPTLAGIDVIGLEDVPLWYAKRDLLLAKDDFVEQSLLNVDFESLNSLQAFSSVMPAEIEYVSSDNVVILYRVKKGNPNRLDIGVEELENNEGVALFGKVKRYNNLIYSDFLQFQTQLSYLNNVDVRSYQINYKQPWLFNRYPLTFDLNLFTKYRSEVFQDDLDVYNTIREGGSVFFTKPFKTQKLSVGAGIRNEHVSPQSSGDFSSYDLRSWSLFFEQNDVLSFINPKQGYRTKIIYEQSGHFMGVDLGGVSFSRFSANYSQYFSFFNNQVSAFRVFGGVFSKQSSTATFESEKFSLGGANSLRGYQEFAMYGNYRFSFNLEQRIIFNRYSIFALFYDAGFINDSFDDLFDNYYQGYGVGYRWLNTFMPIRLDFAFGKDFIIHFSLSQTF